MGSRSVKKHMEQLLILSTAPGTRKVCKTAVSVFEFFIHKFNLMRAPFDSQLTLFVTLMSIADKSPRTVSTYVSGIKSHYKLKGVQVQNEFLLHRMLQGVRRLNKGELLGGHLFWSSNCLE